MVQTICPALLHSPSLVPNSLPGTVVPVNNEAAVVYLPVATAGIPTAITVIPANVVDIPAAVVDAPTVTHTFGGNNIKEGKEDKKQRKRDPDVVIHQAPETLIPKRLQRNTIRRCKHSYRCQPTYRLTFLLACYKRRRTQGQNGQSRPRRRLQNLSHPLRLLYTALRIAQDPRGSTQARF